MVHLSIRMLPIRCYTCGKVLGNLEHARKTYREFFQDNQEEDWLAFFEKYRIQRYCCRRILMCHQPDVNHEIVYELPSSIQSIAGQDGHHDIFLAR